MAIREDNLVDRVKDLPKEVQSFGQWITKRPPGNDHWVMRKEVRVPDILYVDFLFGGEEYVYCAEKAFSAAGISCESLALQLKAFEFVLRKGSWSWDSEKKQHRIDLLNALDANHRLLADGYRREADSFNARVECNALAETGKNAAWWHFPGEVLAVASAIWKPSVN